jgi:hypothetical protein
MKKKQADIISVGYLKTENLILVVMEFISFYYKCKFTRLIENIRINEQPQKIGPNLNAAASFILFDKYRIPKEYSPFEI